MLLIRDTETFKNPLSLQGPRSHCITLKALRPSSSFNKRPAPQQRGKAVYMPFNVLRAFWRIPFHCSYLCFLILQLCFPCAGGAVNVRILNVLKQLFFFLLQSFLWGAFARAVFWRERRRRPRPAAPTGHKPHTKADQEKQKKGGKKPHQNDNIPLFAVDIKPFFGKAFNMPKSPDTLLKFFNLPPIPLL